MKESIQGYNDSINRSVGEYSTLQSKQVYSGNQNNKNAYDDKNKYKTDNVYRADDVYNKQNVDTEIPRFKRFSDLKILNEIMMHMSNNTLPDDSRIEILSQGEKGEIKNILSYRILKISTVPALISLFLGMMLVLTDSFIFTLFCVFIYLGVIVRTFFYPAKLYYENIRFKTTSPARIFFEEMDYWYKVSVVKIYVYLIIVSALLFMFSFYEDNIIQYTIEKLKNNNVSIERPILQVYLESISFSISLKVLAVSNIVLLVIYSKFINSMKMAAEIILKERMKKIRNESLSRVEQIQKDKNAIN